MKEELLKDFLYDVVGALYNVHAELGAGLNESIYQEGLEIELKKQDIFYEREKIVHPYYRGQEMESTFRLDFLCFMHVIVECKSVSKLTNEHRAQLYNYMRITQKPARVLVNFAPAYMELERYLYNPETNEITTFNGEVITL
jgi:GxxExxY protein